MSEAVTAALLRRWPLPAPDADGDKDARGRVMVIGGSREVPGGAMLAGLGALRAGAGKLRLAVPGSVAVALAVAIPEARVTGLAESGDGDIAADAVGALRDEVERLGALLIGPGMLDEAAAAALVAGLAPHLGDGGLVLDAAALAQLEPDAVRGLDGRVVLTPHAGEMASLLGIEREGVEADPRAAAARAADRFGAVTMMKGGRTWIVSPGGNTWCYADGCVGLATSGSGDALAGVVVGLLGRGAEPAQAAAWAAYLHGEAGNRLTARHGAVGFLARELLAEVPAIMNELAE